MSVADVGGGVPIGRVEYSFPFIVGAHQESAATDSSVDFPNSNGGIVVVEAIDCVVTGDAASASQVYFTAAILGVADFYYDAQTIGEGGGVHFHWRGMIPLQVGATLHFHLTVSGPSVYWSFVASGLAGSFPSF